MGESPQAQNRARQGRKRWSRPAVFPSLLPNLYAAYRKAHKGKRNRAAVASFEFDLERNLLALQDELS